MSLFVGIPYQLPTDGSWADYPPPLRMSAVRGQRHGQQTIWPDPQGVQMLTVQP